VGSSKKRRRGVVFITIKKVDDFFVKFRKYWKHQLRKKEKKKPMEGNK
jgi:hypothetical protein